MESSDDWWHAYYKLCTRFLGAALLINGALGVLLFGIEASVRGDYSGLGSLIIGLLLLTLPYLPVALWPLAILPLRTSPPDLKRERLKAMNAFSALVILLWAPGIMELVANILDPPIHDGGGWWFAVLGVLIFSPVIILCARLEERYFTGVSVRLFGKSNSDEPKTVPTIAVMLILNFVQITVVHFGLTICYMFWR